MHQPDSRQDNDPPPVTPAAIGRLAALGGLGFLVASLAGDLTIGAFPQPGTSAAQLVSFFAAHHTQLRTGGTLLGLAGLCLVPFGLAVWARVRQASASPLMAGLAMISTALVAVTTLASAGTFVVLGDIGAQRGIAPAALQAWQIMAAEGSLAGSASTFLFLVTAALAGLAARAVTRWLAWPALLLAVLVLVPDQVGFLASLVFPVWAAAAGTTLLFTRQLRSTTSYTAIQKEVRHA